MADGKRIKGGDWDNHVGLIINFTIPEELQRTIEIGNLNTSQQTDCQRVIQNMKRIFGANVVLTKITTYKTPLSQHFWTDYIFHHEYAVIETQSHDRRIYWSTEKNGERIWLSAYESFQECRDYQSVKSKSNTLIKTKRYQTSYWKPQIKRQAKSLPNLDFYEFVRWIYREQEHKSTYHFFKSNCQCFCEKLYSALQSP